MSILTPASCDVRTVEPGWSRIGERYMPIAIDLHTHAKVSKSIPFRMDYFDRMVRNAERTGLSGFATTEHFDAPDYWEMSSHLTARFPYEDGHLYVAPGMTVLTGAEIDVVEGGHVIAIGPYRLLAELDRSFGPNLSRGFFPTARALIESARLLGITVIGAHPGRPKKRLLSVGNRVLAGLNALEINGSDVASGRDVESVVRRARRLGLPLVGSSDAHVWPQIGQQRTIVPMKELTREGLNEALASGRTDVVTLPSIQRIVHMCKRHKALAKLAHDRRMASAAREPVPATAHRPDAAAVAATA